MINRLNISNEDEATDWVWGQKFLQASEEKSQMGDRNITHYVQINRSDQDPGRLPYLGSNGNISKEPSKQGKESRHYLNLLLNERGAVTDYLEQTKNHKKQMEVNRVRRDKVFDMKAFIQIASKPSNVQGKIFLNHLSP
jgi:hypothetical protein